MAESVMIALANKGMGRQEAHEVVRKASMEAQANDQGLKEVLEKSKQISKYLSEEELVSAMDPENYVGAAAQTIDEIVKRAQRALKKDASRSKWDPY